MALTPEQVERVQALADRYDREAPALSFVDWLDSIGERALRVALIEALTEVGDTSTIMAMRETPSQYAAYGFTEEYVARDRILREALDHLVRGGGWRELCGAKSCRWSDDLNWEDTQWGRVWDEHGGMDGGWRYFDALPKIEQGAILDELAKKPSESNARRRKRLKTAVLVGGIAAAAIFAGPAIAAKLKAVGAKIGGAVKGAVGGAVSDRISPRDEAETAAEIDEAEAEARRIIEDPATQAAIASGEIPAPPTSVDDPAWIDYATVIAQWYLDRKLERQGAELEDEQAALLARSDANLRSDLDRLRRDINAAASGQVSADEAAVDYASAGLGGLPPWGIAALLGGAALFAITSMRN